MKNSILRHLSALLFAGALLVGGPVYGDEPEMPRMPAMPAMPQQNRGEDIRAMKIAFFSDALSLTPEQSQQFWPVYNQYWSGRREIGHRRRDLFKIIRDGQAGDAQFRELLSVMDAERKLTADYIVKFRQILPADKVAKVFVADEDFKNYLLKRATGGGGGGKR